ncbi:DUF192 domain-containing protein [Desulfothermobacter acidiphilus]|uniref:DUF192 domain-containing protein n=1 Tax=Desulfothermobacter acidiphilus TaxID=1938353 RepID=UPI003F8C0E75
MIALYNRSRDCLLAKQLHLAQRWWQRLRGLLGRAPLRPGEGLLLEPCWSVHTFFLPYPIDVLFYDREHKVVACFVELNPWRATPLIRRARGAVEFPAGTLRFTSTQMGDRLEFRKQRGEN